METRHLYGDPATSPFVRYGGGYAVFPPNDVRDAIAETLDALSSGVTRESAWRTLVRDAWIGGQAAIHPASTWHALFLGFAAFFERHFGGASLVTQTALQAARIAVGDDSEVAWEKLEAFLLKHIDVISGWSSSWVRDHAERLGVVRRDDGTYWYPEASGTLIQIHGATTLPETRLDFITDAILRPSGPIRQILTLFAMLAISKDFRRDPSAYPTALRMAVYPESQQVSLEWHRLHHSYQVRSVKWRPRSNLCDPEWLAQLLLAQVVDATSRDPWAERVEIHHQRPSGLEPQYRRQLDYILDTSLLIGGEDEVYLSFDGRIFRWMNGTPESRGTLTVGCNDDPQSTREAEQAADRLLSFLVWHHRVPITRLWGAGGPRRSLPTAWEPRMSGGLRVSPQDAVARYTQPFSTKRWFALALYREGVSSRSVFYQFLSLWKILELALPDPQARVDWIEQTTTKLSGAPKTVPIYDYLEASGRDAVAHASLGGVRRRRKKKHGAPVAATSVDPDNHKHRRRINKDTVLVRELAEKAIETGLTG